MKVLRHLRSSNYLFCLTDITVCYNKLYPIIPAGPGSSVECVFDWRSGGLGFDPPVRHIFPLKEFPPTADSSRAAAGGWRKDGHLVLVIGLESLSLPRKCVVRVTGRPDMTIAVYWDVKHQYNQPIIPLL